MRTLQSRQWRRGRCLEYVGVTDHPTTKMQCGRRATAFLRTLRQQVPVAESALSRKRRRPRQTNDPKKGDVLRQPHDIRWWDTDAAPVLSSGATNQRQPSVRRVLRLLL